MFTVRKTATASGKTAVQVVLRHHRKTKIVKHIGSAGDDKHKTDLVKLAW